MSSSSSDGPVETDLEAHSSPLQRAADSVEQRKPGRVDTIVLALFFGQTLLFMGGAIGCIILGRFSPEQEALEVFQGLLGYVVAIETSVVVTSTIILTSLAYLLQRWFPRVMLHVSCLLLVACIFGIATVDMLVGDYIRAGLKMILVIIVAIIYVRNRPYFGLSGIFLATVAKTALHYHTLIYVVLVATLIAQFYGTITRVAYNQLYYWLASWNPILVYLVGVFLLLCILWTTQVFLNIIRTIISGVFVKGYYSPLVKTDEEETHQGNIAEAIWPVLQRVFGGSFAAICHGSTLVWPIFYTRKIVSQVHYFSPVSLDILDSLLALVNRAARRFNYMAFTILSSRSTSYQYAANTAWDRVKSTRAGRVMSDLFLDWYTFFLCIIIGILSAFADLLFKTVVIGLDLRQCWSNFTGSVILGMVIPALIFSIVDDGATAILVCFSMDSPAMADSYPVLYSTIRENYP